MTAERVRIPCCVPFCAKTVMARPGSETLCAAHWRTIPLKRRRVFDRVKAERMPWGPIPKGRLTRFTEPRVDRVLEEGDPRTAVTIRRLWRRLKAIAIERSL